MEHIESDVISIILTDFIPVSELNDTPEEYEYIFNIRQIRDISDIFKEIYFSLRDDGLVHKVYMIKKPDISEEDIKKHIITAHKLYLRKKTDISEENCYNYRFGLDIYIYISIIINFFNIPIENEIEIAKNDEEFIFNIIKHYNIHLCERENERMKHRQYELISPDVISIDLREILPDSGESEEANGDYVYHVNFKELSDIIIEIKSRINYTRKRYTLTEAILTEEYIKEHIIKYIASAHALYERITHTRNRHDRTFGLDKYIFISIIMILFDIKDTSNSLDEDFIFIMVMRYNIDMGERKYESKSNPIKKQSCSICNKYLKYKNKYIKYKNKYLYLAKGWK